MSGPLALFTTGWRAVREAGPLRLAITAALLVLALLVARFSWNLPFTDNAERAIYDYRAFVMAGQVEQDDRVAMLVYTDETLMQLRKRSPLDRGLLAAVLRNIDPMGAKAIGIDILFDQPQDEDDELVAALRSMETPVLVAYADVATNELDIVYDQQEYLRTFLARLEGSRATPASIRLTEETGVTRIWPDIDPDLPPLLGRAMLSAAGEGARTLEGYRGAIRYRRPQFVDRPVFTSLPIELFADPELAPALASQIAGRYVLLGGDITGNDRALTPFSDFQGEATEKGGRSIRPPGIEIHAATIAQMLDGARLTPVSFSIRGIWAIAVVLAAAMTALIELRGPRLIPLLALQVVAIVGLPFLLHARGFDTYGLPAIGPALGWIIAFSAVVSAARASGAVQRRFAQGALGKYLPESIAREIIEKPELLELHGTKREIFVVFTDLEGFTKMSHALEPETVATLLNAYLEKLSRVVLEHGGVIDKFVGDAVVAFWGAPIARPDDGDRAARAGYAMWEAGEAFRASVDPALPPVGKTRVGMHFGEAVVGNFGGSNRIQYTALGDSMNTASRLEAANKALDSSVMASREFVSRTSLDWWRPMGRVLLRGRARPVDIFEPAPGFAEEDKARLEKAFAMLARDREAAISLVGAVVQGNRADKALENLLQRMRGLNEEGVYVLE